MRIAITLFLTALLLCVVGWAGNETEVVFATADYSMFSPNISTNSTARHVHGYLDSIYLDISGSSTQTVTISTTRETLLTASAVTADTLYRPGVQRQNTTGVTQAGLTNQFERFFLLDLVTVVVNPTSTTTNAVTVYIRTAND